MAEPAVRDKILVIGSNSSSASESTVALLGKVNAINAKHGPFTAVFCAGDVLPDNSDDEAVMVSAASLLDGSFAVEAPVYFMKGSRSLPQALQDQAKTNGGDICRNVTYLGDKTVFTLSSGLRIGVLSGLDGAQPDQTAGIAASSLEAFAKQDSTKDLDILLTHNSPASMTTGSSKPLSETTSIQAFEKNSTPQLHSLLKHSQPKYHFCSSQNVFWEREPYIYPTHADGSEHADRAANGHVPGQATRFLSLGKYGNTSKQRWFYAFTITAKSGSTGVEAVSNAMPCPFIQAEVRGTKRDAATMSSTYEEPENFIFGGGVGDHAGQKKGRHSDNPERRGPPRSYVCRICNEPGHWIQDCTQASQPSHANGRQGQRAGPPKEIAPEECWFCLSNPKVTKHLIASIGVETYLTLPKGQLIDTLDQKSAVPGGGHCLIIPIAHYPTLAGIPQELSAPVHAEITAYKRALKDCYRKHGCDLLSFEISRTGMGKGGHAHIQTVPVPTSLSAGAEALFVAEGAKAGYTLVSDTNPHMSSEIAKTLEEGNYFRVDLPDGSKLVHRIRPGDRFSLQFGRQTTALLLEVPDRADWKSCSRSDEDEGQDCQAFKAAFQSFDPSG